MRKISKCWKEITDILHSQIYNTHQNGQKDEGFKDLKIVDAR